MKKKLLFKYTWIAFAVLAVLCAIIMAIGFVSDSSATIEFSAYLGSVAVWILIILIYSHTNAAFTILEKKNYMFFFLRIFVLFIITFSLFFLGLIVRE